MTATSCHRCTRLATCPRSTPGAKDLPLACTCTKPTARLDDYLRHEAGADSEADSVPDKVVCVPTALRQHLSSIRIGIISAFAGYQCRHGSDKQHIAFKSDISHSISNPRQRQTKRSTFKMAIRPSTSGGSTWI